MDGEDAVRTRWVRIEGVLPYDTISLTLGISERERHTHTQLLWFSIIEIQKYCDDTIIASQIITIKFLAIVATFSKE